MADRDAEHIPKRTSALQPCLSTAQDDDCDHKGEEKSMQVPDETPRNAPDLESRSSKVNENPFILVQSRKQRAAERRKKNCDALSKNLAVTRFDRKSYPPSILLTGHEHPKRWDVTRQEDVQRFFPSCTHAFLHEWGGIRVQFKSEESAKSAMAAVSQSMLRSKLGEGTKIYRSGAQTKIALTKVPRNVSTGDILHNFRQKHGYAHFVSSRGGRESRTHTLIFSVTEQKCADLKKAGHVMLGPFLRLNVEEPHAPKKRQCFYCQSWLHISRFCSAQKPQCRKCAGFHESRLCTSSRKKCANCGKHHFASSIECPRNPNRSKHESRQKQRQINTRGSNNRHSGEVKTQVPAAPSHGVSDQRREKPLKRVWKVKRHQTKSTQTTFVDIIRSNTSEALLDTLAHELAARKENTALHFIRECLYKRGLSWGVDIITKVLTSKSTVDVENNSVPSELSKRHTSVDAANERHRGYANRSQQSDVDSTRRPPSSDFRPRAKNDAKRESVSEAPSKRHGLANAAGEHQESRAAHLHDDNIAARRHRSSTSRRVQTKIDAERHFGLSAPTGRHSSVDAASQRHRGSVHHPQRNDADSSRRPSSSDFRFQANNDAKRESFCNAPSKRHASVNAAGERYEIGSGQPQVGDFATTSRRSQSEIDAERHFGLRESGQPQVGDFAATLRRSQSEIDAERHFGLRGSGHPQVGDSAVTRRRSQTEIDAERHFGLRALSGRRSSIDAASECHGGPADRPQPSDVETTRRSPSTSHHSQTETDAERPFGFSALSGCHSSGDAASERHRDSNDRPQRSDVDATHRCSSSDHRSQDSDDNKRVSDSSAPSRRHSSAVAADERHDGVANHPQGGNIVDTHHHTPSSGRSQAKIVVERVFDSSSPSKRLNSSVTVGGRHGGASDHDVAVTCRRPSTNRHSQTKIDAKRHFGFSALSERRSSVDASSERNLGAAYRLQRSVVDVTRRRSSSVRRARVGNVANRVSDYSTPLSRQSSAAAASEHRHGGAADHPRGGNFAVTRRRPPTIHQPQSKTDAGRHFGFSALSRRRSSGDAASERHRGSADRPQRNEVDAIHRRSSSVHRSQADNRAKRDHVTSALSKRRSSVSAVCGRHQGAVVHTQGGERHQASTDRPQRSVVDAIRHRSSSDQQLEAGDVAKRDSGSSVLSKYHGGIDAVSGRHRSLAESTERGEAAAASSQPPPSRQSQAVNGATLNSVSAAESDSQSAGVADTACTPSNDPLVHSQPMPRRSARLRAKAAFSPCAFTASKLSKKDGVSRSPRKLPITKRKLAFIAKHTTASTHTQQRVTSRSKRRRNVDRGTTGQKLDKRQKTHHEDRKKSKYATWDQRKTASPESNEEKS